MLKPILTNIWVEVSKMLSHNTTFTVCVCVFGPHIRAVFFFLWKPVNITQRSTLNVRHLVCFDWGVGVFGRWTFHVSLCTVLYSSLQRFKRTIESLVNWQRDACSNTKVGRDPRQVPAHLTHFHKGLGTVFVLVTIPNC